MAFLFMLCVIITMHILELLAYDEWKADECGTEASPNPIHQSPWLVLLEYYRRGSLTEFRCGGTLISSLYVVTAAHCAQTHKFHRMSVRLGDYNVVTDQDCVDGVCADPYIRRNVVNVFAHPGYDGRAHDIAVLKLDKPAPYTDFIRPACLPSGSFDDRTIFYASGWGEVPTTGSYSAQKKFIELPNWKYTECIKVYEYDVIPKHIICAGGVKNFDTCRGDSGSPLIFYKKKAELYGVTSLGPMNCGKQGAPGIYTSVLAHMQWITEVATVS